MAGVGTSADGASSKPGTRPKEETMLRRPFAVAAIAVVALTACSSAESGIDCNTPLGYTCT